jgi:BAH domain
MEFLPAEGDLKGKGKGKSIYTRARIAWYYRPGDLSDRAPLDSRLLLAAIYSEVQPITHIRGKCHVRHRDMIRDLNTWRKTPDCFYFYRFFDPYIKKEYEVVRSRDINNGICPASFSSFATFCK